MFHKEVKYSSLKISGRVFSIKIIHQPKICDRNGVNMHGVVKLIYLNIGNVDRPALTSVNV